MALLGELDATSAVEWGLLCAVMFVGLYATYHSLTGQQIPSVASWGLLAAGVSGQLVLWRLGVASPRDLGLLLGTAFVLAYLLYAARVWSAQEGRLYWAIVVALPTALCGGWPLTRPDAPVWAVLVNAAFLLTVVTVALVASGRWRVEWRGRDAQTAVSRWAWLSRAGGVAAVTGYVVSAGTALAGRPLSLLEAVAGVLLAVVMAGYLIPRQYRTPLAVAGVGAALYAAWQPESWQVVLLVAGVNWAVLELGLWLGRHWQGLRQEVAPGRLRAGMVPVGGAAVPAAGWGQPLSPADITELRARAATETGNASVVEVAASLRWAPALVGGAALTAILGGTVVNPVARAAVSFAGLAQP